MTDPSAVPGPAGEPRRGSKGVAVTNWLVSKASGVLERTTSRRGFLIGSAMAGSAVAVAGCVPVMKPGSSYTHVTDCAGGLCTDGYTEFCCTINDGLNACPPDSFWGGWWRADYSTFCNGTRYYIDCMQNCCGPRTGYQNFCAGCEECRCAGGCDSRRVYCNYFRYGQCHTDIVATGPIACRVVLCVPPYSVDPACSTATLVDNATAEHTSPCITAPLPATVLASPAAAVEAAGKVSIFARSADLFIASRTFDGSSWSSWAENPPPLTSSVDAAADPTGVYVVGRGTDAAIRYNRQVGDSWIGEGLLPGLIGASDPAVVADADGVHVFVRSVDTALWWGRFQGGVWQGWSSLGGRFASNPSAASSASGLFVCARSSDYTLKVNRFVGGSWSGWVSLRNPISSDPAAVTDGSTVTIVARVEGNEVGYQTFSGTSWSGWQNLGGYATSDPSAVQGPDGLYVFARGGNNGGWCNRRTAGGWTGFSSLGGNFTSDIAALATASDVFAFVSGGDQALWWGHFPSGQWSGWQSLGGALAPVTAIS